MKFNKKLRNLVMVGIVGLSSLMPFKAKAEDNKLNILTNFISLNESYKPEINKNNQYSKDHGINENITNLGKSAVSWYLADAVMVAMHESGHSNEAFNQGFHSDIKIEPRPFWINGSSPYEGSPKTKMDKAKIDIAGFVNAGNLAEALKREINVSGVSKDELRFKSMLALACELNLPVYFGMHYLGTDYTGIGMDDIQNFSDSSGIKPEQMLIGSGLQILLNSPYLYELARNALGHPYKEKETRNFDISFRFDGGKYMLSFNANPDVLEDKISDIAFSKPLGNVGKK